jgi:hypothetical protein
MARPQRGRAGTNDATGSQRWEPTCSGISRLSTTGSDVFAGERLSVRLRLTVPDSYELHGMQKVRGSNPLSSTEVRGQLDKPTGPFLLHLPQPVPQRPVKVAHGTDR